MEDGPRDSGFLPPEPSGPEPDLGDGGKDPTQQLPRTEQTQAHAQQPAPQGWPPPQQGYGQQPPPQQVWGQPPSHGQPQSHGQQQGYGQQGYGPPPGWQGQPPGWQQQPGWQPQAQWATGPLEPDNGAAVAGFSLSLSGGILLLLSAGFSSLLSLGLSIAGWIYSRKGKEMVTSGKTRKHEGLAQAGFIIGIISTVLSVLATLGWGGLLVALIASEEFRRDLENSNGSTISMDLSIGLLRGLFSLLS